MKAHENGHAPCYSSQKCSQCVDDNGSNSAAVNLCYSPTMLRFFQSVCMLFFKFIIRGVSLILPPVFVTHHLHNVQVVLAFYAVLLPLQPA